MGLPASTTAVLRLIAENAPCALSYTDIAMKASVAECTAKRAISSLEREGLIIVTRGNGRGRCSHYEVPADVHTIISLLRTRK